MLINAFLMFFFSKGAFNAEINAGIMCDTLLRSKYHVQFEVTLIMSASHGDISVQGRADNLVLERFGFSALSVARLCRRLVLNLVLKTSNSARLVLPKSNEHYAKW